MAVVGLVTSPWMGGIADRASHEVLADDQTFVVLVEAGGALQSQSLRTPGPEGDDLRTALDLVTGVLTTFEEEDVLPPLETANAMRAFIESGSTSPAVDRARSILGPAENHGGLVSFRYLVPLSLVLVVIFGVLYLRERRTGGYRAERLT
jgi:hypothetical protein